MYACKDAHTLYIYTHTHTHTYIYIYMCVCVCVCVCVKKSIKEKLFARFAMLIKLFLTPEIWIYIFMENKILQFFFCFSIFFFSICLTVFTLKYFRCFGLQKNWIERKERAKKSKLWSELLRVGQHDHNWYRIVAKINILKKWIIMFGNHILRL